MSKKVFLLVAALGISLFTLAQNICKFDKATIDMGSTVVGKPVSVEVFFTNTSNTILKATGCFGTSGRVKVTLPKSLVMPKQKGSFIVTFDAKIPGSFTNQLSLQFENMPASGTVTVQVRCDQ